MQYASLEMHTHVVLSGSELVECRHWYWVRRLVGRRGFCRKCKAGFEKITRELLAKMEADCMAAMLPEPEPTTYPTKPPAHRGFLNIEGS